MQQRRTGAPLPVSALALPLEQETLANFLRSEQLARRVIADLKLYQESGFDERFARLFPGFRIETASADGKAYLLERFEKRLLVETLPRSLVIQVRFRSRDAAMSVAVVNDLIRLYEVGQMENRA
jgi:uncharacterized protein involved in exopolysaccharide biosynthesis